jgi:thiamine pyrophosphokinase
MMIKAVKNIIIISNGRFGDAVYLKKKIAEMQDRLIICCDGAAYNMAQAKIKPDVIIGDMDSIDAAQLENYRMTGIEIIKYPSEKDFTDTELALDYALKLDPVRVHIWGALGGRIDHTLANIFLLKKGDEAGIKTCLLDEYGEAFLAQKEVVFTDAVGCTVSILALSPKVEGITLNGFAYLLNNETLRKGETRGLSNYIKESPARINFLSGELLVIRYWQNNLFPEAA